MDIKKYTKCRPFLCLRRGVSACLKFRYVDLYLFSAYAEVFPSPADRLTLSKAFLCLRRGVSSRERFSRSIDSFSLPTQRCFRRSILRRPSQELFSAYAELFLPVRRRHFSLPTQRCFSRRRLPKQAHKLFSAYAEVFLESHTRQSSRSAFLCLRRGVSDIAWVDDSKVSFSLPTQRCFFGTPIFG